jgi:hypothetical protein
MSFKRYPQRYLEGFFYTKEAIGHPLCKHERMRLLVVEYYNHVLVPTSLVMTMGSQESGIMNSAFINVTCCYLKLC